jgi:hypothetical protein
MNLDKLGQEMLETGTQVLLRVDAKTGKFLADLMRGNDSVICKPDTSLTEALRQLLHEGSVDKLYCGWSTEDVLALESKLSVDDATEVLGLMEAEGDAMVGFSWATLEVAITKVKRIREKIS